MKPLFIKFLLVSAIILFLNVNANGQDPITETRTFSWNELRRADGNIGFLEDTAWFCQAKTATGQTECHLGTRPPQPGCYVLLDSTRTKWLAVDDAAAQLGGQFVADGKSDKKISSKSGYGCGIPRGGDWWLLFNIY